MILHNSTIRDDTKYSLKITVRLKSTGHGPRDWAWPLYDSILSSALGWSWGSSTFRSATPTLTASPTLIGHFHIALAKSVNSDKEGGGVLLVFLLAALQHWLKSNL